MRRTLVALGVTVALAGCTAPPAADAADVADVAAMALQEVGFEAPAATPSASAPGPRKALRRHLRKNTLHGEVTIQTKKNGVRTVVVQRGAVTAVSATEISVKSSDGFVLTWSFEDTLRVVQNRKAVETSALKTGTEIGIAGFKEADRPAARLILIK